MVHVAQTRRKEKMMSESKIAATKVARLGVLVLALLTALVAVQTFGAKPAEASVGAGIVPWLWLDDTTRLAEDSARLEAHVPMLTDDAARQEAKEVAAQWPDDLGGPEVGEAALLTDTEVAKRQEALKSKIEEDNIEYVKERGCLIVDVAEAAADAAGAADAAEMGGVPPTDDQVRDLVETDVPTKYLLVESEEGSSGFYLVPRKQIKSELVEINHLVRRDIKASYSYDEPDVASDSNDESDVASDVASEMLSEVKDTVCEMK